MWEFRKFEEGLMSEITTTALLQQLSWRYAVKRFDADRKLDSDVWDALEQSLILTPSSYGLQPWKFLVITDARVKAELPKISWGQKQPQDCSHMVVLAARRSVDAAFIDRYMNDAIEKRGLPKGALDNYRDILVSTVEKMDNHLDWNARQVYIALGQLMVAAALVGVDTCPMEGIDTDAYDQILGLTDSEYTTVVGCAVGFRHPEDEQAQFKKVRYSTKAVVDHV